MFAAGDVRAGASNRVAGAVGDGAMAVRFAQRCWPASAGQHVAAAGSAFGRESRTSWRRAVLVVASAVVSATTAGAAVAAAAITTATGAAVVFHA